MKILFIGNLSSTNDKYNYEVLKKKNKVDAINTEVFLISSKLFYIILYHFYFNLIETWLFNRFKKRIVKNYDLIWVESGELLGKKLIENLKKKGSRIVFFCKDNPFYNRDKSKWRIARKALHLYDKVIFHQPTRIKYAKKNNINFHLIKPVINKNIFNFSKRNFESRKFERDVLMIGTWFQDRGKLAKRLIEANINLEIFGPNWEKDKNYITLKKFIKSNQFITGFKYANIIKCSKMTICLPNVENDDDITRKSLEIPLCGSLLLAKNTKSHRKIFKNKFNAVLFNNHNDLIKNIKEILKNEKVMNDISFNGFKSISKNKIFDSEKSIYKIINNLK